MENSIDSLLIQHYLEGKLNPKQMHELEKRALEDPFLADAMEGYAYATKPAASQLSILQRQLEDRIAQQQEEKNVFNFTWQRLSIAAAAGLMFISAGILFWMNSHKPEQLTASHIKKVEVELSQGLGQDKTMVAVPGTLKDQGKPKTIYLKQQLLANAVPKKARIVQSMPQTLLEQQPGAEASFAKASSRPQSMAEVAIMGRQQNRAKEPEAASSSIEISSMRISPIELSGKVISKSTRLPLPGVAIKIKGNEFATNTNAKGEFALPDSVKGILEVRFIGYEAQEASIKLGEKPVIELVENAKSLNENVVISSQNTAYLKAKQLEELQEKGTPAYAMPAVGWGKYNEYLKSNTRMPSPASTGKVTVGFTVDDKGRLKNFNIAKSLNPACDAEAIRVVKKGPRWMPALVGQEYWASIEVSFAVKKD